MSDTEVSEIMEKSPPPQGIFSQILHFLLSDDVETVEDENIPDNTTGVPDSIPDFIYSLFVGEQDKPNPVQDQLLNQNNLQKEQDSFQDSLSQSFTDYQLTIKSKILSQQHFTTLLNHMPPITQNAAKTKLLYSLERHGTSLKTLVKNCTETGPNLILIRTDSNCILGVYTSHDLGVQDQHYYGNGSCFLFCDSDVYPATGRNNYYILNNASMLAFGGAKDGKFGLWVDGDLEHGHLDYCDTFENRGIGPFTILELEVWGFEL